MLLLQNHSKSCFKSVITQCQEIPLVKCTVYGYHDSCPTTGGVGRFCSPRLETLGKAKNPCLGSTVVTTALLSFIWKFINFSSQIAVLTIFSHVRHFFKILKLSGTLTSTYSFTYLQILQLTKQSVQAVTSRIVLSLSCLVLTFQSMCMSQKLITPHNLIIPRKQFFFLLPELPSIIQIYLTRMKDRFFI